MSWGLCYIFFLLLRPVSVQSVAAELTCEEFAKTHPRFAELIGTGLEYPDEYGSLFKVGICTDMYDCGDCTGGGKAGYCETWVDKKRTGLSADAQEHTEKASGNCIGKFASLTLITVGDGMLLPRAC